MLGMATRVIRLVMTEMLTMVAIVGIILLQMRLGTMLGRSSRHKGGCSCNKIGMFVRGPALQSHCIDIGNEQGG